MHYDSYGTSTPSGKRTGPRSSRRRRWTKQLDPCRRAKLLSKDMEAEKKSRGQVLRSQRVRGESSSPMSVSRTGRWDEPSFLTSVACVRHWRRSDEGSGRPCVRLLLYLMSSGLKG